MITFIYKSGTEYDTHIGNNQVIPDQMDVVKIVADGDELNKIQRMFPKDFPHPNKRIGTRGVNVSVYVGDFARMIAANW